jgi:hypothetical protein
MHHISVLEIPPPQSWSRVEIIAWLQDKSILSPEGFFKAELLNLATASKASRKR